MASVLSELTVPEEVLELLREHGGEEAFRTTCDIVRECFPDLLRWEVYSCEDPEIDERVRLIGLEIVLPSQTTIDDIIAREKRFHVLMAERVPLELHVRFGFHLRSLIDQE
jgi:hypothetical protein